MLASPYLCKFTGRTSARTGAHAITNGKKQMSSLIVAFAGPDCVGKTTAALQLQALGFAKYSMAGPAKEICNVANAEPFGREHVAAVYEYLINNLYDGLKEYWEEVLGNNSLIVIDDLRRNVDLKLLGGRYTPIILFVIRKDGHQPSSLPGCGEWMYWDAHTPNISVFFDINNNKGEEELRIKVLECISAVIAQRGLGLLCDE